LRHLQAIPLCYPAAAGSSVSEYTMQPEEIQELIQAGMAGAQVTVTGDGYKNEAVVVSETFEGMSTLQRHKAVYATVNEKIASGELHALTIKTYTPDEWQSQGA
jgi:acid stress-induced BolA-like protein IbaG/YrbA